MNEYTTSYGAKYFIKRKGSMRFDVMKRSKYSNRAQSIARFADESDAIACISIAADRDRAYKLDQERKQARQTLKQELRVIQGERWSMRPSNPIGQLRVVS